VVIGEVVVLATDSPIRVVCVADGQVYTVDTDVPTSFANAVLNVFGIIVPLSLV
jgi:hypothetical protein